MKKLVGGDANHVDYVKTDGISVLLQEPLTEKTTLLSASQQAVSL